LSVFDLGLAEMIRRLFPTTPEIGFKPNFTGYNFDIDWYKAFEAMAQSPNETILVVSIVRLSLYSANTELFMIYELVDIPQ